MAWYDYSRRWFMINLTEDVCVENNLDHWRAYWRSAPYQGMIINCGGVVGYYQSKYSYQKKAKGLNNQDIFGMFANAAHEDGLAVAARFDVQYIDAAFADTHPEWFLREKDGSLFIKHSQASTCINSTYYSEILPLLMQEIIEKYHPQAFTDNSWKANRKTQICYCENCKRLFNEYCGEDIPGNVDWQDPVYRKWIKWSYKCRVKVWDKLDATARQYGGEDCMWAGMFHGDPMNRLNEFIDFHEISKRLRFLFLDHQCRDSGNGMDVEQNSMLGSMYRLMSNENLLITECTNHYARFGACGRWFRQSSGTPVPILMWEQEGMAGGIAPWVHFFSSQMFDMRREHISEALLGWHKNNEQYLKDRTELADVAVVWSQENGDFYGRDKAVEIGIAPWLGMRHAMLAIGMPFLPINIHDIDKHGGRVKTLILPDIAAISDDDTAALIRYIDCGGNLIFTGKTALLDDEGEPRTQSALWSRLKLYRKAEIGSPLTNRTVLEINDETGNTIAFSGMAQLTESHGVLKPVAKLAKYPDECVIYKGILESGARIVYFGIDVDREYSRTELPAACELIEKAIDWTLEGARIVHINTTGSISIKLYKQDKRFIIHLNNVTGSSIFGGMANSFIPIGPIELKLSVTGIVRRVYLAVTQKSVPFECKSGMLTFKIEELVSHEMIIVE